MAYIAPIHKPTSVRHALRSHLLSGDEESLVLSTANRLEIWRLSQDTLTLVHSKVINGTIAILNKLRPKDAQTDILFVGTERFEYFTLAWNPETLQFDTIEPFKDAGERHMRDSQSHDKCLVDPSGRFMATHLWEGVMTVWRLGNRKNTALRLEVMEQVRLSELFIKACTFIYTETGHPKIALLYQGRADSQEAKLATYRLTSDDRNIEASHFNPQRDRDDDRDIPDPGAGMLIPVKKGQEEVKRHNFRNVEGAKAHLGGLIVVGETRLLYIDDVTKRTVTSVLREASIFVAWAEYNPTAFFLADDYGTMHLLTIVTEGVEVLGMKVTKIGVTSRASNMVYLDNDLLFVASHYGNSQLFKLQHGPSTPTLQEIQVMMNIGPILDFAVMDMGNRENDSQLGNEYSSGQARIVSGSGVYKDGSLRSVRSGVGLEDIGILADLDHTRSLFSLASYGAPKVDTLVASFLTETRIFRFDSGGEVEELGELSGMILDQQTLLARNLPNGQLLQVTTTTAQLLDMESGVTIASWAPGEGKSITNASANAEWLLLSVEGTDLVSVNLEGDLQVVGVRDISDRDQVACIHVAPQLPGIGVVGFWTAGTVSLVDLQTLEPLHGESLRRTQDDASIPRDLALVQVLPPEVSGPTLFIAMEDGNVVTFNISSNYELSNRKSVILGTRQARFHLLPQQSGIYSIFATTEFPSLIYGSEKRIIYSAVTAEDATCLCPFDTEAFPDAIVVATASQIKISQIDTERRTHVRPLPMGETIRRIAYSANEKVFGLGCIGRELVNGEEVVHSSFRLVDEIIFDTVGQPFRLGLPGVTELVEAVIRAELPDSYGNPAERFIVGTSFLPDPDIDANTNTRGRILVFGIDSDRNPYLVLKHELKGACQSLAMMDGKILAALTKTVVVIQYEETSSVTGRLTLVASYRPSTYPLDLAVHGNMIAVADLMKSLSIVQYVPGEAGLPPKLVEVARHYQSAWGTAVAHVQDESWLEADADGNLIVLRRNPQGVTAEDKMRLEMTSEINLGEMVNKIRGISVESSPNAMIIPKAFLGTVEGGIYLFGVVAPHAQDLLLRFQNKLATVIQTVGHVDFKTYRAFRNAEREGDGPFRFLDGELLERFLDVDENTQKEICQGLGPSVEDMRNIVEGLRRMH
ncbi:mono-functional DNA-alkylating methyl methanesulfonate N-term-domain-containing protein [Cercophora newfieldiana]|uniref:Mono-functional DNA-alkylating methyl methanesulfonate N-term-domain-containing protein n=1 Tax=Cercophora newfieldiana TaxID=92897 RepID=A0AA39XZB3_9PEZI|nr:mono-functional DNA-alkylating methyl methanesulfonate N-term-domain-containing protein [Cercophora newfieldiana]